MSKSLSIKVSEKGCLSVYGVRRFPVSFYAEEWEIILSKKDAILGEIKKNRKLMDERGAATRKEKGSESATASDRTAI